LKALTVSGILFAMGIVAEPVFACTAPDSVIRYTPSQRNTPAKARKTAEGYVHERVPGFKVTVKEVELLQARLDHRRGLGLSQKTNVASEK